MSENEEEQIAEWRFKCFAKLGLSIGAIESLLSWGSDLHQVAELVAHGCPEPLMLRILQPLDDPVDLRVPERIAEYSVKA